MERDHSSCSKVNDATLVRLDRGDRISWPCGLSALIRPAARRTTYPSPYVVELHREAVDVDTVGSGRPRYVAIWRFPDGWRTRPAVPRETVS